MIVPALTSRRRRQLARFARRVVLWLDVVTLALIGVLAVLVAVFSGAGI